MRMKPVVPRKARTSVRFLHVPDAGDLKVVWNPAFVVALVSENDNFRYGDEELLGRDDGTSTVETGGCGGRRRDVAR